MTEFWEQWTGSLKKPMDHVQSDATVTRESAPVVTVKDDLFGGAVTTATRPGRKLISAFLR